MNALIGVLLSVYEELRSRKSMFRFPIHSLEKVRKGTKNNLYMQMKFYFLRETVTFSQYQGMSTYHIGDSSALFVIILVDLNILALVYRYFFIPSIGFSTSQNEAKATGNTITIVNAINCLGAIPGMLAIIICCIGKL